MVLCAVEASRVLCAIEAFWPRVLTPDDSTLVSGINVTDPPTDEV
jgi:hypothetical protein